MLFQNKADTHPGLQFGAKQEAKGKHNNIRRGYNNEKSTKNIVTMEELMDF